MSRLLFLICIFTLSNAQRCVQRKFNKDSFVCVCNSTYCDFATVLVPEKGTFRSYVSNRDNYRLDSKTGSFNNDTKGDIKLYLNPTKTYQTISGFGSSFTDSAGLNIKLLSQATQLNLLKSLFDKEGNKYNLCRLPIGGSDFSTRPYSLDDIPGDVSLKNFSLTQEDYEYKISFMKKALEMNPELKFMAASWTAPPWMKTFVDFGGWYNQLREEYYQAYAEYLVKFLTEYKLQGLPIWALSTGNNPIICTTAVARKQNCMLWVPYKVVNWVINNLAPSIARSISNETIITTGDHPKLELIWYYDAMFRYNNSINKFISGLTSHWYDEEYLGHSELDRIHATYPDKLLIMSEACTGFQGINSPDKVVDLGSWVDAEKYIISIIENLNHWIIGWIDWNLALNKYGGPNWIDNYVNSPIITVPESDEFYKQPMHYALAHFSKFIPRGSKRIEINGKNEIKSVAVSTPNNETVIILYNKSDRKKNVTIVDPRQGNININIDARSIQSIIYKQ
ncbi:lysosomal acid glucosylceramidase-like [Chelonus insularis]|uniref:lysosomal acid glucosylceramidase-like n=1 Tax=Chelonus insularis TaxID=460826 RepID=UPI00158D8120|nr:lysosomal acid glucosylceramidase-like [Chelonus insularis]